MSKTTALRNMSKRIGRLQRRVTASRATAEEWNTLRKMLALRDKVRRAS